MVPERGEPGPDRVSDVLIVGAGPAGGWLAGDLAAAGLSVTLIDRLRDFHEDAFSSAAVPRSTLERFALPDAVVAATWSGWQLLGPGTAQRTWRSGAPLGAVLDFARLRAWLAARAEDHGAHVKLGTRAIAWASSATGVSLTVAGPDGVTGRLQGRWLVDATGSSRRLIGAHQHPLPEPLVSGVGVEWLIRVPESTWRHWSDQLTFVLGSDAVPQGYGWIFPMQAPLLKVGVCRLEDGAAGQPALGALLTRLLDRLELGAAEVIDRHGGRISSSIERRERHRWGRLVGLGDAVSTANLLGGEGIRHALLSARVLAPLLIRAMEQERGASPAFLPRLRKRDPLGPYPRRLKRQLGWRWSLSGRLARRTWLGLLDGQADQRLDRLLDGLERQPAEVLSSLLFDYRFERYGIRALPDLIGRR